MSDYELMVSHMSRAHVKCIQLVNATQGDASKAEVHTALDALNHQMIACSLHVVNLVRAMERAGLNVAGK